MADYERLSASDNTFLDLEKNNTHMHVGATLIFDSGPLKTRVGGVDIERLRDYVGSRLHLIPRYRQKLARIPLINHPVWIDDEHFNIGYHVRHACLPAPGSTEQLRRLAARIMSQQLDRTKPLWELWVIEGLHGGEAFSIVQKVHHCMIDGISGVDLMTVLMTVEPEETFEQYATWAPQRAPTAISLVSGEALRRAREPIDLAARIPSLVMNPSRGLEAFREGLTAVGETLTAGMQPTAQLPFNRRIGPHRRFAWLDMDLADVKEVKNRLGGTLNDVVLATAAGAVRVFLRGRGCNFNGQRIRANVPVSVRREDEKGTLGNRIALWMTDLPVGEADPVARLEAIRATTARLKKSKQALGAEVLANVSELTSSTLLSLAVRLSTRGRPYNLVVTNVPGPQLDLYMLGAPMTAIYPMVNLLRNQGVGIALFSYSGKLFWGVLGDWDLMPDIEHFVAAISLSFDELRVAAGTLEEPLHRHT